MSTVESLVKELSEVQDLLVALPDDAFAEREELLRRRDELQALAEQHAEGADAARPTEDLRAELVALQLHDPNAPDERLRRESRISRIREILTRRGEGLAQN